MDINVRVLIGLKVQIILEFFSDFFNTKWTATSYYE